MTELSLQEMREVDGGSISGTAVACGLLGFGAGAVIGFVVIGGIILIAKNI